MSSGLAIASYFILPPDGYVELQSETRIGRFSLWLFRCNHRGEIWPYETAQIHIYIANDNAHIDSLLKGCTKSSAL